VLDRIDVGMRLLDQAKEALYRERRERGDGEAVEDGGGIIAQADDNVVAVLAAVDDFVAEDFVPRSAGGLTGGL
jgi:hypothetical protein